MRHLFFAMLLLMPSVLHAATLSVSGSEAVALNGTSPIAITLATEGQSINAIEGSVLVPSILTVRDIRYTGSVVSLWIEEPHITAEGTVRFAAVLPGGYETGGADASIAGNLFTLYVAGVEEGEGAIRINTDTAVYLNDGVGTAQTPTYGTLQLSVLPEGSSVLPGKDITAPEEPYLYVVSGDVFNRSGKVLILETHDKDSGINRYEVARSFLPLPPSLLRFGETEVPISLSSIDLVRTITVRVIDREGNMTYGSLMPGGLVGYLPTILIVILISCLLYLYYRTRTR